MPIDLEVEERTVQLSIEDWPANEYPWDAAAESPEVAIDVPLFLEE